MKSSEKNTLLVFLVFLTLSVTAVILFKKSAATKKALTNDHPNQPVLSDKDFVTISNQKIYVDIADTPQKRHFGLSGRTKLAGNEGMLFDFKEDNTYRIIWMKDMLIAIDVIWINDGKIVQLNKNIPPPKENTPDNQLNTYKSNVPVDHVLEVSAGFCDKNNIRVGDKVDLTNI